MWVWFVIFRKTRQVLDFTKGDRTDAILEQAWSLVPEEYQTKANYTDHRGLYSRLYGSDQHCGTIEHPNCISVIPVLCVASVRGGVSIQKAIAQRFQLLVDDHKRKARKRWKQAHLSTLLSPQPINPTSVNSYLFVLFWAYLIFFELYKQR